MSVRHQECHVNSAMRGYVSCAQIHTRHTHSYIPFTASSSKMPSSPPAVAARRADWIDVADSGLVQGSNLAGTPLAREGLPPTVMAHRTTTAFHAGLTRQATASCSETDTTALPRTTDVTHREATNWPPPQGLSRRRRLSEPRRKRLYRAASSLSRRERSCRRATSLRLASAPAIPATRSVRLPGEFGARTSPSVPRWACSSQPVGGCRHGSPGRP